MRPLADADRIREFLARLGDEVRDPAHLWLVGGSSAVIEGWRSSTVDVDLRVEPEPGGFFEAIARLKDEVDVNVELADPSHFLPELPGWRERSPWIGRFGRLDVYHYDWNAQLLSKIERGHATDDVDVRAMLHRGLVDAAAARALYDRIEPDIVRFPAIDRAALAARVAAVLGPRR
jgi:hypothetical protein